MTMQNPKIERSVQTDARLGEIHRSEFIKEKFKEEFKKSIHQLIRAKSNFWILVCDFAQTGSP